ncbi:MAG TPA: hypothetical protein VLJ76_05270 [Gaiellaceae bacterium]|nr:hypothetical protein [Gaiellaceae bacterium]
MRDTGLGFSNFAVSPNGRTIAGWPEEPDSPQAIGIASVTGAGLRELPRPSAQVDESDPSFSPDGIRIVFERRNPTSGCCRVSRLVVQAVKGGAARPLGVVGTTPRWSPDGRWIAFAAPVGQGVRLEIVPPTGGRARILASASLGTIGFSWAPDSKQLVYEVDADQSLGIADLAGHSRKLDIGRIEPFDAAFSPDGRRIVFTGTPASGARRRASIYVVGADGHGLRRLA